MHPVQAYIEHAFNDLPETEEIKRIKNDLNQHMTDRYDELISQGKTESAALGTVIIEIGDRDAYLEAVGYNLASDLDSFRTHTLEETEEYLSITRQSANMIGLGIMMMLIGVSMPLVFESYGAQTDMNFGIILLFILVAAGVGLTIYGGMRVSNIEQPLAINEAIFYLPETDRLKIEGDFKNYKKTQMFRIPLGVMLCILSPISVLIFGSGNEERLVLRFGIPIMFLLIGIGVYLFVTYGMTYSGYEKVLNIGEYALENRKLNRIISPIAGVYWILATVVYLAWSFATWDWHITWIIWPIAGISWALINELIKWRLRNK